MNTDPRLLYERVNVVKALIVNPDREVLLIQEPEMNEWMPGRWGLPGGRPVEKESLKQAFTRKVREDIGVELEPKGIFRIEELLIEGRTVLMYILVCETEDKFNPVREDIDYKWLSQEQIEKMDITEFTEYYNKHLLIDYLKGARKLIDMDMVETHTYYLFAADSEYMRWWESRNKTEK